MFKEKIICSDNRDEKIKKIFTKNKKIINFFLKK